MTHRVRSLSVILVTLSMLSAGCMGEEESPFYGEEIKPAVPVEDFILLDENGEP